MRWRGLFRREQEDCDVSADIDSILQMQVDTLCYSIEEVTDGYTRAAYCALARPLRLGCD